jgi:hypothetical protein
MQPLLHPSESLSIDLKNPEVDVTDDRFKKVTFYTDGRQLPKKVDEDHPEVAARWSGSELVSEEKGPLGGKMSRTFELSSDGRRLYETINVDHGKKSPIVIRYAYDVATADVQSGIPEGDPDRPVLRKHSDSSASADGPNGQDAASDQSAAAGSDQSGSDQAAANQQADSPSVQSTEDADPNRPVLKRHDSGSSPQ